MSRADDLLATLPPPKRAVQDTSANQESPADQLLAQLPVKGGGSKADELLAGLPEKKAFNTKIELAKFVWGQTPWAKAYQLGKIPAEKSREGLKRLAGFVPEPTAITSKIQNPTLQNAATVGLGIPKVGAEVMAEMAPSFIHPAALAIQGGGRLIGDAAKSAVGSKAGQYVASKIPEGVKRAFNYRYGQPAAYKEAAEGRLTAIQNAGEDATGVGTALQNGLTNAQQLRAGQILRGGVSVSPKELPLRLRANYARQALDKAEAEAKALDLIPENALSNFSRKELAALRTQKTALDTRIQALRTQATPKPKPVEEHMPVVPPEMKQTGEPRGVFAYNDPYGPAGERSMYTIYGDPKRPLMAQHGANNTTQPAEWFKERGIPIEGIETRAAAQGFKPLDYPAAPPPVPVRAPRLAPAVRREVKGLEQESGGIQDKLVNYYTNSGQKYMPRLYTNHEALEKEASQFGYKRTKMIRDRFLKRGDLPEDLRVKMGEIKQPAYPVAKGLAQTRQAIETEKMYRTVASNPRLASPVAKEGFVELPKTKNYGSLAGKHVHPEVARDMTEMHAAKSTAEKVYDRTIGMWKFGKVVLNPATHFRNVMSNSILADLGGMNHAAQYRLIPKAAAEVLRRGPVYEQARQMGLIGSEFFGAEIKAFRDNLVSAPGQNILQKAAGIAGRAGNKIGNAYQAEEQVFKLGKFMHNLEKGMDPKAAAADAEKWLFNYAKVSPAVNAIRKSPFGAPFITFTAKALPRIAEAATQNPMRVYKYTELFRAMDKVSQERLNLSDEEMATIKRNTRGQSVVLPTKDATGAPYVLDLSFILPWGDIGESGGLYGLPPAAPPAGPVKAIFEAGINKSQFKATQSPNSTGQIYDPETDFGYQKVAKVSDYLLKTALPSLTPGIPGRNSPFKGGYSFDKIKSAIQKKPDYFGRVRPLKAVLADTLIGLKASPVDPAQKRTFEFINKKKAMDDLTKQTAAQMRHPGISHEEKQKILGEFMEKVRRLSKNFKATVN